MKSLTVLYDAACPLCVRCRHWLETQNKYVAMELLPSSCDEAKRRFGAVPWLGAELVAVSDAGEVWVGPAAFILCLWALVEWREWSYRLSGPAFIPLAERFFHAVSARRFGIAALLGDHECPDGSCRAALHHGYR